MKVKLPVLLLMILAAAIGYLLGTERGRAQRDVILVKLGRKSDESEAPGQETGSAGTEVTGPDGSEGTEDAGTAATEDAGAEATEPTV